MIFAHGVAAVARLAERAVSYRIPDHGGRSRSVAAQATTLGKPGSPRRPKGDDRVEAVEELIDRYPLRGIKGPDGHRSGHARSAGR